MLDFLTLFSTVGVALAVFTVFILVVLTLVFVIDVIQEYLQIRAQKKFFDKIEEYRNDFS